MKLKIYKLGEDVLRQVATPVPFVTDELRQLAADMVETMSAARGVGLAAEQVGRLESMCVIDVPLSCEDDEETKEFNSAVEMPLVMFNPIILSTEGEQKGREGCLSLPNVGSEVTRPRCVTAQYTDLNGLSQTVTARGFLARAILHETDHLKGVLYIDHLDEASREKVLKKLEKANKKKKK